MSKNVDGRVVNEALIVIVRLEKKIYGRGVNEALIDRLEAKHPIRRFLLAIEEGLPSDQAIE